MTFRLHGMNRDGGGDFYKSATGRIPSEIVRNRHFHSETISWSEFLHTTIMQYR